MREAMISIDPFQLDTLSTDTNGRHTDTLGTGSRCCVFNGVHKATERSTQETTHTMLYGKNRRGNDVKRMENATFLPRATNRRMFHG